MFVYLLGFGISVDLNIVLFGFFLFKIQNFYLFIYFFNYLAISVHYGNIFMKTFSKNAGYSYIKYT